MLYAPNRLWEKPQEAAPRNVVARPRHFVEVEERKKKNGPYTHRERYPEWRNRPLPREIGALHQQLGYDLGARRALECIINISTYSPFFRYTPTTIYMYIYIEAQIIYKVKSAIHASTIHINIYTYKPATLDLS